MKFLIVHVRMIDRSWFETIEQDDGPEPGEFQNYPDETVIVLDQPEAEDLRNFLGREYP